MHKRKDSKLHSSMQTQHVFTNAMSCDDIIRLAKNIITARFHRLGALKSPQQTISFLQMHIGLLEHEEFCCIFLDQANRVICFEHLFAGTIGGASIHPREVVKAST